MKKADDLKKEAMKACVTRGHMMGTWIEVSPTVFDCDCLYCGASVRVDTDPAPNGIDVGGRAVAVHCRSEKPKGKVNKFLYMHVIQGYYDPAYGWEDLCQSESWREARADLRAYNREERTYRHRLIRRRVPNPEYQEG